MAIEQTPLFHELVSREDYRTVLAESFPDEVTADWFGTERTAAATNGNTSESSRTPGS